jgi:hypothetical protein
MWGDMEGGQQGEHYTTPLNFLKGVKKGMWLHLEFYHIKVLLKAWKVKGK